MKTVVSVFILAILLIASAAYSQAPTTGATYLAPDGSMIVIQAGPEVMAVSMQSQDGSAIAQMILSGGQPYVNVASDRGLHQSRLTPRELIVDNVRRF